MVTQEDVRRYLDKEGVGPGTNITLHMCNCLVRDFANDVLKEDREVNLVCHKAFIKKIEEYVSLIGDELNDTAIIASNHGWVSHRVKQGEDLRRTLTEMKYNLTF